MTHEAAAEMAKPEMAKPKAIRNDAAPSWPRRRRARDHFGAVAQDAGVASQDLSPKAKLSACREPFQEALRRGGARVLRNFVSTNETSRKKLEPFPLSLCLEQGQPGIKSPFTPHDETGGPRNDDPKSQESEQSKRRNPAHGAPHGGAHAPRPSSNTTANPGSCVPYHSFPKFPIVYAIEHSA